MSPRELCAALMRADTEAEVVELLETADYWDDANAWRPINDDESNFSTIGNQQSDAISALAEKIINSVDARLIRACRGSQMDPEALNAPQSMQEAVERFFREGGAVGVSAGRLSEWSDGYITAEGRLLTLVASGNKPEEGSGRPSITIADQGEGQTPDAFPDTFMSLKRSNKLKVPFVQGKFSMGGTGALQFGSPKWNLQLIISRRDPELLPSVTTGRDLEWGFTIVRRERPTGGIRNSVYTYLAPLESGRVLSFPAEAWPIFPESSARIRDAYSRESGFGSLVKLYEYDLPGSKSNIVQSGGGLLRRIETGLPQLALPVRLYEMRDYAGKAESSFATNALGLVLRLDRDRASSLAPEAPLSASVTVAGKSIPLRIYVFASKERAREYRVSRQGVVFGVNGQAHGSLSVDLFKRKNVGLGYLSDSLLVYADCTAIDGEVRENLFMNSRDRLREGALAKQLEDEVSYVLSHHPVLKELNSRRRAQMIENQLQDERPLADALRDIVKNHSTLAKLFKSGFKLATAFPPGGQAVGQGKGESANFTGVRFPTYFRVRGHKSESPFRRDAQLDRRARITFETDVENSYFIRPIDPGVIEVVRVVGDHTEDVLADSITGPFDGLAHIAFTLPEEAVVGDTVAFKVRVTDSSRDDALASDVELRVVDHEPTGGGGGGTRRKNPNSGSGDQGGSGLALPNVKRVPEAEWDQYEFDSETALKIVSSEGYYDYFVNIDNKFLRIAQKDSRQSALLLENQFAYGLVLLGIAMVHDFVSSSEEVGPEDMVAKVTKAVAPILVPMLQTVGTLGTQEE